MSRKVADVLSGAGAPVVTGMSAICTGEYALRMRHVPRPRGRLLSVRVPLIEPRRIPLELRSIPHWCLWRYEDDELGRRSKPPYDPLTFNRAWPNAPETWSSFDFAYERYRLDYDRTWSGLAFALDGSEGIVGVDIDHLSRWPDSLVPWRIAAELGSYTEYSPSHDGLRIFCHASMPEGRHVREYVEMYGAHRIMTVTGDHVPKYPTTLVRRQQEIEAVHHEFLGTDYARGAKKPRPWPGRGYRGWSID